jgi:predicted ester cyclase
LEENSTGSDTMSETPPVTAKADPGLNLEEMKAFVRQHFEDFVNRKMPEVALRNFSEDFLDHDEAGGVAVGPRAAMRMMNRAYERWPDLHVTIEDIVAEGDKVMVRNVWRATEKAIGKRIGFRGFVLWRFAQGKIVERWATLTPPGEVVGQW